MRHVLIRFDENDDPTDIAAAVVAALANGWGLLAEEIEPVQHWRLHRELEDEDVDAEIHKLSERFAHAGVGAPSPLLPQEASRVRHVPEDPGDWPTGALYLMGSSSLTGDFLATTGGAAGPSEDLVEKLKKILRESREEQAAESGDEDAEPETDNDSERGAVPEGPAPVDEPAPRIETLQPQMWGALKGKTKRLQVASTYLDQELERRQADADSRRWTKAPALVVLDRFENQIRHVARSTERVVREERSLADARSEVDACDAALQLALAAKHSLEERTRPARKEAAERVKAAQEAEVTAQGELTGEQAKDSDLRK